MKARNLFCLCSSRTEISTWPTLLSAQLLLLIRKTIGSFQFLFPCGKAKLSHKWKHLFSLAFSANILSINILIVLMHCTNFLSFLLHFHELKLMPNILFHFGESNLLSGLVTQFEKTV